MNAVSYCTQRVMSKVLVVGGGLTGAVTSSLLAERLPNAEIHVWDKSMGTGGRMSTRRSPDGVPASTVDLGAQYVTASKEYFDKHSAQYTDLLKEGLLKPINMDQVSGMRPQAEGTQNFVAPQGISSVVKHFIKKANVEVKTGRHIVDLSVEDKRWTARTEKDVTEDFDAVVVTMPVPQIFQLEGTIAEYLKVQTDISSNLAKVAYSSRYALGVFFDSAVDLVNLGLDGKPVKYIYDHDIFRFISVDNVKRGVGGKASPTSVVLHTSVKFGKDHELVEQKDLESVIQPILKDGLHKMFPEWPRGISYKTQKWRYSQTTTPYPGTPGCVVLNDKPLLLFGGDGFTQSNFDGCIDSAEKIVDVLKAKL